MIVMTLILIEDQIEIAGTLKEEGPEVIIGRPPERGHHSNRGYSGRDYAG